ncbi:MAG: DUF5320 domain-containing protein [Clostridiales bacterium]|nr:DUF5320 domain-containing protein [Clostridiales bacterium]
MPRLDGTGPMGRGAMTGRGAGLCAYPGLGARLQNGPYVGYGRGFRRQFYGTGLPGYSRSDYWGDGLAINEKTYLADQKILLSQQLKLVKERLAEMEDSNE